MWTVSPAEYICPFYSLPPTPITILHTAARANLQKLESDCMAPCLSIPKSSQSLQTRSKHLTWEGSRSFVPASLLHLISLPPLTVMGPIIAQVSCLFWNTSSLTRPLGLCTCRALCLKCPGPSFICYFKDLFKWHGLRVLPLTTQSTVVLAPSTLHPSPCFLFYSTLNLPVHTLIIVPHSRL